jgi:hypothetical protein
MVLTPALGFGRACALPMGILADGQWVLEQSTLTYHVSHPLDEVNGVGHAGRGNGVCHAGQCDFLIAVAVKSFDSGDSNRDLHMLQVTRGGEFPLITVRRHIPDEASLVPTILRDLKIQFAGQTAHCRQVPFERLGQGTAVKITGTIRATLSDFKIDPPSLLTFPI